MPLSHDEQIQYHVLSLMCDEGVTNTREIIDRVVAKGFSQADVLRVMTKSYKEGLFNIEMPKD